MKANQSRHPVEDNIKEDPSPSNPSITTVYPGQGRYSFNITEADVYGQEHTVYNPETVKRKRWY